MRRIEKRRNPNIEMKLKVHKLETVRRNNCVLQETKVFHEIVIFMHMRQIVTGRIYSAKTRCFTAVKFDTVTEVLSSAVSKQS